MGGQVPLQLRQGGEIQTALHANVLLAFFVLQFMGPELAGVGEASAAHPATEVGDKVFQLVECLGVRSSLIMWSCGELATWFYPDFTL